MTLYDIVWQMKGTAAWSRRALVDIQPVGARPDKESNKCKLFVTFNNCIGPRSYGSLCMFLSTGRKEILVWLTPFLYLQMFQTQCLILPSAPLWEKWENLLFGESSYASSTFSELETVFHTQDKPLLPLALFPLRCVLWLCVYSDYV